MKKGTFTLNLNLLSRLLLTFALIIGGGNVWADDVIYYDGGDSAPSGWTADVSCKFENGEIIGVNTYSTFNLTSQSALLSPGEGILVTARGRHTTNARVQIYYSTTNSFSSSKKEFTTDLRHDTENSYQLLYINTTANNYYIRVSGYYAAIKKIEKKDLSSLSIDENTYTDFSFLPANSTIPSVTVKYTASQGWNTICMPFNLRTYTVNYFEDLFGSSWSAYQISGYSANTLTFSPIAGSGTISPNTPLLVYAPNATGNQATLNLANVSITYSSDPKKTQDDAIFQGTYAPITKGNFTSSMYGVTSAGQIRPGDGVNAWMKGYRAYFTGVSAPSGGSLVKMLIIEDEGTTDLGIVKMVDAEAKDVYTLTGQKVQKGRKGIYIVNGKKVVIK